MTNEREGSARAEAWPARQAAPRYLWSYTNNYIKTDASWKQEPRLQGEPGNTGWQGCERSWRFDCLVENCARAHYWNTDIHTHIVKESRREKTGVCLNVIKDAHAALSIYLLVCGANTCPGRALCPPLGPSFSFDSPGHNQFSFSSFLEEKNFRLYPF